MMPMFNGQRYRAHKAMKRSLLDSFLRSTRDKCAGLLSEGWYSIFLARAIARRQSKKFASQFTHVKVAASCQSRIESCPDRNGSTSGANDPKDSRHFVGIKCFHDFWSSTRLVRSARRKIPSRRSSSTGFEDAISKSTGDLRQCDSPQICRSGDGRCEALNIREIGDVFCVVFQDDWHIGQTGCSCSPPNIHHHPTHHSVVHPAEIRDVHLAYHVSLQHPSRDAYSTGFALIGPLVAATSAR